MFVHKVLVQRDVNLSERKKFPRLQVHSQKYVEVGMRVALRRLVIAPAEFNGFFPSAESINGIMDSIKLFYHDAWNSWGEIPLPVREQMWNYFRTKHSCILNMIIKYFVILM